MGDVAKAMRMAIEEAKKKNPDVEYSFIDSSPDTLRERTQIDGFAVVKDDKQPTASAAGEVRVGDLILAGRPRKVVEEERKFQQEKTQRLIQAPVDRFYGRLSELGGKYLKPLTPGELERDKGQWSGGGNKQ